MKNYHTEPTFLSNLILFNNFSVFIAIQTPLSSAIKFIEACAAGRSATRAERSTKEGSEGGGEAPAGVIEKQRPTEEAEELAQQHEEGTLDGRDAIEAQRDGKDIAHKGQPCEQCQPDTPAVDMPALCLEFLLRDVQPTLYPFPPSQPADDKGGEAAQPVAQGAG